MKKCKQVVYLTPGFGNQVFQYRYAKLLRQLGYQVELVAVKKYITKHEFIFEKVFNETVIIKRFSFIYLFWQYVHTLASKLLVYLPRAQLSNIPFQDMRIFNRHLGYWQSNLSITDTEDIVINNKIISKISKVSNTVSVHVRLGDYHNSIYADHYEFIVNSINDCVNKEYKRLKIVTNSPLDGKILGLISKFDKRFKTISVYSGSVVEDLIELAESDELILSNSTLSLYAAALARRVNSAKCFLPSHMFIDGSGKLNVSK
jgi:hypothetical protein